MGLEANGYEEAVINRLVSLVGGSKNSELGVREKNNVVEDEDA